MATRKKNLISRPAPVRGEGVYIYSEYLRGGFKRRILEEDFRKFGI